MGTSEIIVIGGGITGCATTYELSKRGVKVTLIEREALHAMGSGWTLAGVRQSGRHAAELPIARAAVARWATLADELGAPTDYRRDGNLRLALLPEEADTIRQVVTDGIAAGVPLEYIADRHTIREIAPDVAPNIAGASFCPTDGHADNIKTVRAYADAARNLGARIVTGVTARELLVESGAIRGVHTSDGPMAADCVIVAAGIYAPRMIAPLGLNLPLAVVHCPVVQTVPTEDVQLKPVLGVATGSFAARATVRGGIRFIGASVPWPHGEHTATNTGVSVQQLESMTRTALAIVPRLADVRIEHVWGGLIDDTPDNLPVLDAVADFPGLILGTGFSGHGFGIGPVTGEILANLAMYQRDDRFDMAPFRLNRFATGTPEEQLQMLG